MPDGIFANQKFQFGFIFGVPLCGNRWYILWLFGIFYGHLVESFSHFRYVVPRKIWQPFWQGETVYVERRLVNKRVCVQNKATDSAQEKTWMHLVKLDLLRRPVSPHFIHGYQGDQGSMLWSQCSAIFANFLRKNWRFSQKPMLW
jgi:hypothetical protein